MNEYLELKKANCKNCYKCIRYCPIKSIRFSNDQASIIQEECVLCGQCFVVCPQGAKEISSEINNVKAMIYSNHKVIASIAPSFIANYPYSGIKSIKNALKSIGFYSAEETAMGATMVKQTYEKMMDEKKRDVIISSCCQSVNLLIQKYFPSCLKYLADVKSPMLAHCTDIKKRYPSAKTVFIGPCVSKKDEARRYPGIVDNVLTFEELSNWLDSEGIVIDNSEPPQKTGKAGLFPTPGGIIKTFADEHENYDYIVIDGIDRCIEALKEVENGNLKNCFIEMSSCAGSCSSGPVMERLKNSIVANCQHIVKYAGKDDFTVNTPEANEISQQYDHISIIRNLPDELEILRILSQMGKTKPEDELNCGTCGYATCRDKAAAVHQKKANITMCLPYLKEKAESFSDIIIKNTPNGIIVLDEGLKVQQINKAALSILNIYRQSDVIGEPVVRILDTKDFTEALNTGVNIYNKRTYLADYKKYVDASIIYDKNYKIIIYIIKDVTDIESQKTQKESIKNQTIEIADKVIDNQMKIVQEIAFLLGETAAETKIALTKLKDWLKDD